MITLNGTNYGAGAAHHGPSVIDRTIIIPGVTVVSAAGDRVKIRRSTALKRVWDMSWEKVPEATRAALVTLTGLDNFVYFDQYGRDFVVQIESEDEYVEEFAFTAANGAHFYTISLTIHEI